MDYQPLFNHISRQYEIDLLESEMQELVSIVFGMIVESGMTIEDIKHELTFPREI